MAKLTKEQFVFRKNETVGYPAAEQDGDFLQDCFVDSGDVSLLKSESNPICIVIGRTGAGKSALLRQLAVTEPDRSITIEPEHLAFHYLANSDIVQKLEMIGVNLSLFYKLLWKHIFFIEIVKQRFHICNEEDKRGLFDQLLRLFKSRKDQGKERALKYIEDWGGSFWKDTDARVKEITKKLEEKVNASAEVKASLAKISGGLSAGSEATVSTGITIEVIKKAQEVVQGIQIKELHDLMRTIKEEYCQEQFHRYYIIIDKLDENWVDDSIRYKLIRALIDVARDFPHQLNGKIIFALRNDLYRRVIEHTRDTGFQEEKYTQHLLRVNWSNSDLLKLLDKRVQKLIRRQYTSALVTYQDVLPKSVDREKIDDYLVRLTMHRPRDIIVLFNYFIAKSEGHPDISPSRIKDAEEEYSHERIVSLCDEWRADYPELDRCLSILKTKRSHFILRDLSDDDISEFCYQLTVKPSAKRGQLSQRAVVVVEHLGEEIRRFRNYFAHTMFRVGVFGLKIESYKTAAWSFSWNECSEEQIHDDTAVDICPMLHRALGIVPMN